jgi:hypothetical protein
VRLSRSLLPLLLLCFFCFRFVFFSSRSTRVADNDFTLSLVGTWVSIMVVVVSTRSAATLRFYN